MFTANKNYIFICTYQWHIYEVDFGVKQVIKNTFFNSFMVSKPWENF